MYIHTMVHIDSEQVNQKNKEIIFWEGGPKSLNLR